MQTRTAARPVQHDDLLSRRLKVLVAEDVAFNRQVLEALLQQMSCDVTMVYDGLKAVEAFRTDTWDMVLLDIEMPNLDGIDAVGRMRDMEAYRGGHRTTILAVTAAAMTHQLEVCLEAGFDARISKPIVAAELYATLERHIGPVKTPA